MVVLSIYVGAAVLSWLAGFLLNDVVQSTILKMRADVEDKVYLSGLPPNTPEPAGDETWFAVFMRVTNASDKTLSPANDFEIEDTLGNVYHPVPLDPKVNPFAYVPDPIPPKSMIPQPDSIASEGVIKQGALLLFKIKTDSLQNRPLVLRFRTG